MKLNKGKLIATAIVGVIIATAAFSVTVNKKKVEQLELNKPVEVVNYMSPLYALNEIYDDLKYDSISTLPKTDDDKYQALEFMRQNVQTKFEHYDLNDLTKSSGLHSYDIADLLPESLKDVANTIYKYDNDDTSPVNALFLIAVINQDSNNGTDKIATEKNNLFRFRAYGKTPYESALTFKSKEDSIEYFAKLMNSNKYFNNPNYDDAKSIFTVSKSYSISPKWTALVAENMMMLESSYEDAYK